MHLFASVICLLLALHFYHLFPSSNVIYSFDCQFSVRMFFSDLQLRMDDIPHLLAEYRQLVVDIGAD